SGYLFRNPPGLYLHQVRRHHGDRLSRAIERIDAGRRLFLPRWVGVTTRAVVPNNRSCGRGRAPDPRMASNSDGLGTRLIEYGMVEKICAQNSKSTHADP